MSEPNYREGGPGRLATPAHQFYSHWKLGDSYRHVADQIDLSPFVSIGATIATDVQQAIELLAAKGDLIVVGDGYDTYKNILSDPNNPYDGSVSEFGAYLNSLLNDSTTETYQKLKKSGLVIIKNGTYKISTTINVPAGISIIGENYGTKLVNITANQPIFRIKSDPDRTADKAIENSNPFIFSKRSYIVNLTLGDNFIEPRYTGDTGYKTPLNTSSTSSLIIQEPGSNLICDNVYFMGKQTFSGATLTSVSSIAIKTDSSLPVSTGTQLTLQHSAIDGFSQAIDFTTTSATINTTQYDYLVVNNNKIRVDGYLGNDTTPSNYSNNTFFKAKACNALITNNYLYGNDSGYIDCVFYVSQFPSTLPLDGYGRITISDNWGTINKTGTSITSTGNILRFNGTPQFVFSTVNNNNFYNTSLEWADQNTILSGHNNGIVKFSGTDSSSGDGVLRTFDGYTTATNILRILNARPTVSVGDGTNSFGDFNGVSGINSAITLIGANSSSGKILLKRGTFNFSASSNVSISNKVIEMEGVGGDGERPGTSFVSSDNSTLITLTSSGTLKLKEIAFVIGAANGRSVNATESSLWIESCSFHDGYIQLNNCPQDLPPASSNNTYSRFGLYCDKVKFNSVANTAVDIRGGDVQREYGFFFKDCEWQLRGYSGVKFGAINGESATEMSGIWFTGCNFNLTGSSATSNDWTNNPGIVELTTNGAASPGSHAPALTINDIHFNNCDGYGTSCIIHYIPTDNSSVYTNTPGFGYVRTKLFEMNNCNWRLTPADLTFNPFVVALDARGTGTKISIKNTLMGFTDAGASTNGSQTDDSTFWFPTLTADQWAFATLTADEVEIDNLKMANFNQLSDSGELLVESRKLNINNVTINGYFSTVAGSVPNGRVFINGGGLVNNLQVFGTTIASATDWADSGGNDYGIVLVKSDTYNIDGFTTRGSFPLNINNTNIDDFIYNTSSGTRVGIRISSVNVSSTIDIKDIHISNGRFFNVTNAIKYNSNASTTQVITSLKISGCNMITDGYGIFIDNSGASGSAPLGVVQINNCTIDATITGAYIKSEYFGTNSFVQITNNYFKAPNLTAQVDIYDSTNSTMAEIRGVIMGNITMISGDVGIIRLRGTSNTADATYSMASMPIVGCETGYSTPANRYIINGDRMFHNHAKLRTNNTLS